MLKLSTKNKERGRTWKWRKEDQESEDKNLLEKNRRLSQENLRLQRAVEELGILNEIATAINSTLALYRNSEVYALLGMNNEAFQELNKEIRGMAPIPHLYYQYLLHNPFYDNLRTDLRYHELLARERKLYDEYFTKFGALQTGGTT